jgi:DNA-binding response OmpR family regulator
MAIGTAHFDEQPDLVAALRVRAIKTVLVAGESDMDGIRSDEMPHLALIDATAMPWPEAADCVARCSKMKLPAIALVPEERLWDMDLEADDFLLSPPSVGELVARARRVMRLAAPGDDPDALRAGDLAINTANFEVSVSGRRVSLRFKEYELLLLMASNPGRVYSRAALLNQIWGYDYLGGTRTVDVHIRRLRSKIEDADHTFIETVWQVGYRFKSIERG